MQFLHIVHSIIFSNFYINIGIVTYFVYSCWYLKKDDSHTMIDTHTETTIYE